MKGVLKYKVEDCFGGHYHRFPAGTEVFFGLDEMENISFDGKIEVFMDGFYACIPVRYITDLTVTSDGDQQLLNALAEKIKEHKKICCIEAPSEEYNHFFLDGEENIDFCNNYFSDELFEFGLGLSSRSFTYPLAMRNLFCDIAVKVALEAGLEVYSIGNYNLDSWYVLKYVDGKWLNVEEADDYYSDLNELKKKIM